MKKRAAILLAFAIAIAVSAFLLLLLVKTWDAKFWVSFAFFEFSLVAAAAAALALSKGGYTIPIDIAAILFALVYVAATALIAVLFNWLFDVPLKTYVAIHVAVLAVFMITGIFMLLARRRIGERGKAESAAVSDQQLLLGQAARLLAMAKKLPDPVHDQARCQLEHFYDTIRFSPFTSNAAVADIDNRIRAKVFSLERELDNLIAIQSDNITTLKLALYDIEELIAARNFKIKTDKTGI